jgi:ABC-type Zn uptake system ZnuABC Zn-binding protein ZnuA
MLAVCRSSLLLAIASVLPGQTPHTVCVTTPDLAALCRAIGGEHVAVTAFTKGAENPHFVDARPSMIRVLSRGEVLVEVGRELEIGWLPLLLDNARNAAVLGGQPGHVTAADVVRAMGVRSGGVDRSLGDVHAAGNPHFLTDPLCGLQVAVLLADRFARLWPEQRETFAKNLTAFREALAVAMVGEKVASLYDHDAEKLAMLFPSGKLEELLKAQGDLDALGGWFAALRPWRGSKVVADHDLWPYFAERCGIDVIGWFEPKPGVSPTTAHLTKLIDAMRSQNVRAILSVPYFAPQHAELVARSTGASVASMAHQVGARPGTDDYVAFVDHNVRSLVAALQAGGARKQ